MPRCTEHRSSTSIERLRWQLDEASSPAEARRNSSRTARARAWAQFRGNSSGLAGTARKRHSSIAGFAASQTILKSAKVVNAFAENSLHISTDDRNRKCVHYSAKWFYGRVLECVSI